MSATISIGNTVFGNGAAAAVVIDAPVPLETAANLAARGADLLELRVDLFTGGPEAAAGYIASLRETVSLPLLLTVRPTDDARQGRLELFARLMPLVDAVDIEVDASIRDEVIAMAAGKSVIVSEHDFTAMPQNDRLRHIVDQARDCGAHAAKIAAMAHSGADVARLLTFCHASDFPLVAVAMGEHGALSRVIAPLFGSLFSYTFIARAVAPGQIALDELVAELRRYYPGYRDNGR